MAVRLWYTTSFVETFEGDPTDVVIGDVVSGYPPNVIEIGLNDNISELLISYCYITEVLIQYNDGLCCHFIDFGCVLRG